MAREHVEFLRILADDVQHALDRTAASDIESDRRNLLRTIISAAEGISWVYRAHVLFMAKEFDAATPLIELAFAEATYAVNEQGQIVEQARYISMTAMIRLTTKVAQSICADLNVDFGSQGWQSLRDTIKLRNRITHPKNADDLAISVEEIDHAKTGFFWFLDMSMHVMEATLKEFSGLVSDIGEVVEKLKSGDPETLALYQRAHRDFSD
ncbi:hypothetical protein OSJ57_04810 [Sphingomonas sp. HH69]